MISVFVGGLLVALVAGMFAIGAASSGEHDLEFLASAGGGAGCAAVITPAAFSTGNLGIVIAALVSSVIISAAVGYWDSRQVGIRAVSAFGAFVVVGLFVAFVVVYTPQALRPLMLLPQLVGGIVSAVGIGCG